MKNIFWILIFFSSSGFQVLQARHYGVAQSRKRLIVMAAAPTLNLPSFPKPLYTFAGPHFLEVEVDGHKYLPTCKWLGVPRRALTVWDAISDMPPIHSCHNDPSDSGAPEDHVCKLVSPLTQARIEKIPTLPGSDWRDLPNIYVPGTLVSIRTRLPLPVDAVKP